MQYFIEFIVVNKLIFYILSSFTFFKKFLAYWTQWLQIVLGYITFKILDFM